MISADGTWHKMASANEGGAVVERYARDGRRVAKLLCPVVRPSDPADGTTVLNAAQIMIHGDSDTIFAVAAGGSHSAITLLRISGAMSGVVLDSLCQSRPAPRRASRRSLRNQSGEILDRAVVIWLPGPATYTGEDSLELHLHGGEAVLADTVEALVALGIRPAEAGDFTRRAFLNERIDLLEAEATADLILSETKRQRLQALQQLDGGLGSIVDEWKKTLIFILAQQEALIDFPDEDLPAEVDEALHAGILDLRQAMAVHLNDNHRGEKLRDGLVFAILGAPNAGKSTLMNALAGRDVAIVSHLPGTTRDVLEARMILGGVPVTLLDTAGLRDTADPIEAEGVRRAWARAAEADLVLLVGNSIEVHPEPPADTPWMRVTTKIDQCGPYEPGDIGICALTGTGMPNLIEALSSHARQMTQTAGPPPLTRPRHRAALTTAVQCLTASLTAPAPELRAEDLRLALRSLGRLTGHVGVEDILDSVFRQFCIGK